MKSYGKDYFLCMFRHLYLNRSISFLLVILTAFTAQMLVGMCPVQTQFIAHAQSAKHLNFPSGCTDDGKTDYPGAIDCILNPKVFNCTIDPNFPGKCAYNCTLVPTVDNNCTYTPADRP